MTLDDLETPCLILDRNRLNANISAMQERVASLGVQLRPHLKTVKSIDIAQLVLDDRSAGITVSTLSEAEYFLEHGVKNILYAVGLAPNKLNHVIRLIKHGAELSVIVDNVDVARSIAEFGRGSKTTIPVLIEIDCDGRRAGVTPDDPALVEIGEILERGPSSRFAGVLTHAGASYDCRTIECIRRMAEQERQAALVAARTLRAAGLPTPVVSIGSTPTATFAESMDGVSEVRPGTFMFQDLVMAGLGVCGLDDIALSVLTTVIGHQRQKNWLIVDAGWMAMSQDRGTASQVIDQGYGLVCDIEGKPINDLVLTDVNQEHGVVAARDEAGFNLAAYPIGSLLRILPNHACATAAQHDRYLVIDGGTEVVAEWERCRGW